MSLPTPMLMPVSARIDRGTRLGDLKLIARAQRVQRGIADTS